MQGPNLLAVFLASLIPMVLGMIWYNPKVFGTIWMHEAGLTEERLKGANMPLVFGLSFLFSFFLAFGMQFLVIHQFHFGSILMDEPGFKDPNSELSIYAKSFMDKYGNNYRTFKHGVFHGFIGGVMIALPIVAVNALFERKSFKYIAINFGYWLLSMALMGGVVSACR